MVGHTLNDTLRLRVAIARARGCEPADVEAWSVGEHGPHAVPLLSRVLVRGAPARAVRRRAGAGARGGRRLVRALAGARHGPHERVGRPAGARPRSCARCCEGDPRPWPVSTLLRGSYDVEGVCLTVPAVLGPEAPPRPLQWRLDAGERAAIAAAAAAVEELACAAC